MQAQRVLYRGEVGKQKPESKNQKTMHEKYQIECRIMLQWTPYVLRLPGFLVCLILLKILSPDLPDGCRFLWSDTSGLSRCRLLAAIIFVALPPVVDSR